MRVRGEEGDLRQQADALAVRGDSYARPSGRRRHPVERGERRRHEGVARRVQVAVVAVAVDELVDDRAQRLLARIADGVGDERGIDAGVLRQHGEFVEPEHVVEEGPHAGLEPRAREHVVHGARAARGILQVAVRRPVQQRVIRRRIPQKEAQAAGERPAIEPGAARMARVGLGAVDDEQHVGRDQHALEHHREAAVEILEPQRCRSAPPRRSRVPFGRRQRPAEQQPAHLAQEASGTCVVGGRRRARRAGDQEIPAGRDSRPSRPRPRRCAGIPASARS